MLLWRKFTNLIVEKTLRLKKSATLTQEAGSTATFAGTLNASGTLKVGGVAVTSSAAELNILTGVTATGAEINRSADASTRIVTTTATALSLTVTQHGEKVVLVNTNSTVANTFTLPVATGSGVKFTVINNIAQTQGSIVVAANGTLDTVKGVAILADTTTAAAEGFVTSATSDKVTFNRTTTGGAGPGDIVEAWDSAANVWTVQVRGVGGGTLATPFAAS